MSLMRWLAARLRKLDRAEDRANFIGPPLPPGVRRFDDGRLYRQVSRWNKDFTLHTISFLTVDGRRLARPDDDLEDIKVPEFLRRVADRES